MRLTKSRYRPREPQTKPLHVYPNAPQAASAGFIGGQCYRPGANGTIAVDAVARAPPDGYTLLDACDTVPGVSGFLGCPGMHAGTVEGQADLIAGAERARGVAAAEHSLRRKQKTP
jgi:hypothetical protein